MNSDLITEIKPSKSAPLLGFWYPACRSSDLGPGSMKGTVLLGLPILVCKTSQGAVAAMRDICPHRAMPLSFGQMRDDCVECAYHGWRFDLRTGACLYGDDAARRFETAVRGDEILIRID